MTDQPTDELEPVRTGELLREFSDYTLAELVLEIKEGREALELEKKAHAVATFARGKAEARLEILEGRINTSVTVLNGDSDICIDCDAIKEED